MAPPTSSSSSCSVIQFCGPVTSGGGGGGVTIVTGVLWGVRRGEGLGGRDWGSRDGLLTRVM